MAGEPIHPVETFAPAPAGTRVRAVSWLIVGVFILILAGQAWFIPRNLGADTWIAIGAPLVGVPIVAPPDRPATSDPK